METLQDELTSYLKDWTRIATSSFQKYCKYLTILLAVSVIFHILLQMFIKSVVKRMIHFVPSLPSERSALAELRKKTGYTFSNCKKALTMHENDLEKAEKWLHEQAQSLGWSKATKLEGRQTSQGLVGVAVNKNNAALVEVNCETDFVARNENFQEMVETAAKACLDFAEKHSCDTGINKFGLDAEQLRLLKSQDGKLLSDHLALMIGTVGENATLRRAICINAEDNIHLSCYAHPSGSERNSVLLGKFAGLIALKQTAEKEIDVNDIAKKICQHVVGMNPKKIGGETDKPSENSEEESCLIYQEYLLDDTFNVGEILEENGVEVIDFKRFGCGEPLVSETNTEIHLETLG